MVDFSPEVNAVDKKVAVPCDSNPELFMARDADLSLPVDVVYIDRFAVRP